MIIRGTTEKSGKLSDTEKNLTDLSFQIKEVGMK